MSTPIATGRNGGLFRLVTATANELCVNGEMSGAPQIIESASFTLRSLKTPRDDPERAPKAKSSTVKLLGSYDQGTKSRTALQTCFASTGIFTAETEYLVIEGETAFPFGSLDVAVWHFDDTIRR